MMMLNSYRHTKNILTSYSKNKLGFLLGFYLRLKNKTHRSSPLWVFCYVQ